MVFVVVLASLVSITSYYTMLEKAPAGNSMLTSINTSTDPTM